MDSHPSFKIVFFQTFYFTLEIFVKYIGYCNHRQSLKILKVLIPYVFCSDDERELMGYSYTMTQLK